MGFDVGQVLLWATAFIFSTTCHEAAHAWVAKLGGDMTAYEGGQVSLNPMPHIKREPFGMVAVPVIAFAMSGFMIGWASTPYDPHWAARYPRRSALMSLAGPTANLILAVLSLVVLKSIVASGPYPEDSVQFVIFELFWIMYILNIILFIFNLIPLPPLDGAEALLLFVPEDRAHIVRQKLASVGMFGIIIAWLILNQISGPVLKAAKALI
jgi:Zn-dependent protease